MTIIEMLDDLAKWAEDQICSKIMLKAETDVQDGSEKIEEVHPVAWPLYVPAQDGIWPRVGVANVPSIAVEILPPSKDDVQGDSRTVTIRFALATWNPARYQEDVFVPTGESGAGIPNMPAYTRGDPETPPFAWSSDGWRDAYNFLEIALRELGNTDYIKSTIRIMHEEAMEWGPFTEPDGGPLPNFFPFWLAWCSFKVNLPITRARHDVSSLL